MGIGDFLWLITGCTVFFAALFAAFKSRKRVSLKDVLYQNASPQSKLCLLVPVAERVNAAHRLQRFGFDIDPENIRIVRGRAVLRLPAAGLGRDGMLRVRAGYSAPERYDEAQPAGPWTDVYALCALLFFAMTGTPPPPAYERAEGEPMFKAAVPPGLERLAAAVENGLALDCRKRPALLSGILSELKQALGRQDGNKAAASCPPASKANQKRKECSRRALLLACGVCVLLGGALMTLELNYAQTLFYIENAAYDKAASCASGIPAFYRDAARLQRYTQGAALLEAGQFKSAAEQLGTLGDYQDARRMASEALYKNALSLLETGLLDEALQAFEALGGYADAPKMATETRYRKAVRAKEAGRLTEAMAELRALQAYKDSQELIDELTERIYKQAVTLFGQGRYANAASYLAVVPDYGAASSYLTLCELGERIERGDFLREDFELLKTYAQDFNIGHLLLSDAAIGYYLQGRWQDGSGNTFELLEDGGIKCSLPMPGASYYQLRGASLIVGREADGAAVLTFEYAGNTCSHSAGEMSK